MALTSKQLGQARENSTNAVSVYSPAASTSAIVNTITVANTSAASATVRIFIDDNGTTYDEGTAIAWDINIDAGAFLQMRGFYAMNDPAGNIAYRSSVANALTITIFGVEET